MEACDKHGHSCGHIHARQLLPQAVPDAAAKGVVAARLRVQCQELRNPSLREAPSSLLARHLALHQEALQEMTAAKYHSQ